MSTTRVFVSRRSQQPKLDDIDAVSSLAISPYEEDLRFLQCMFDDADWNLFTAHTYKDGMAQLDRELIPVVICESQLPDGSWKDLSQTAWERPRVKPARPVIRRQGRGSAG